VYPARAAFFVRVVEVRDRTRKPSNLGGDTARAVGERVADGGAHARVATNAVEEVGLQNAWDAQGRRGEEDAERGRGAEE
jgi:hypothetical protein